MKLHREHHPIDPPIDPRIKLLALCWLAILIVTAETWVTVSLITVVVAAGMWQARIGLGQAFFLLRKVLVFVVIILLLQGSSQSGEILFATGGFYFTWEGLARGTLLSLKIILLLFLSKAFVTATSVGEIVDAVEWPLAYWRKGSSHLLMLGLTINFVPLLTRSAQQIKFSQIARGGDDSQSLFSQIRFAIAAALPLFVATLRLSYHLADAIDARGYNPALPRTPFAILRTRTGDWALVGLLLLISGISWFSR